MSVEIVDYAQRVKRVVVMFLPGIFLLGFNIGTGSVTAMAKAGADFGMSLLWTLVASCCCTFFMINLYGRFTLITGETAIEAFKKHIHSKLSIFFVIALGVGVCGSVIGVMGIVADISYRWSLSWTDSGIKPIWFALFYTALVYVVFWNGSTHFFERFMAVIVALMSLCFLVNFFLFMPSPASIIEGFIPKLPVALGESQSSPLLVIASLVGTTVFSGLFIVRTTLVKEAGWTLANYSTQRNDALFSVVLMFIISASIMAAAAGTLHAADIRLNNASQMISILEPLAGQFAVSVFAAGLVAAGISSQFPNILLLPWLICDYTGQSRNMTLPMFRLMVMIISQALNSVILPLTVGCLIYLSNKKSLMGIHTLTVAQNLVLFCILLFSLFTAFVGLSGVWEVITKI